MQKDKKNKVQIKEIAEQLKVSQSTVSVVLSGRGDELRISKETQKRVTEYAKQIGYQPNIYARRLRHSANDEPPHVIALFWREDNLNTRLGKFIQGIQKAIEQKGCRAELLVQPYKPGELLKHEDILSPNRISGAIICGLLEEEQKRLERVDYHVPIVLIGRESDVYHCVRMDDYRAGETCAETLCHEEKNQSDDMEGADSTGIRSAAFIGFANAGRSERRMEAGFVMGCRERGISVNEDHSVYLEYSSHENGYAAAEKLLDKLELPAAFMVADFRLAGGIIACCHDRNIRVPEDLRLLFFEDSSVLKYHKPSLSAVDVPTMEMAERALELLFYAFENVLDIPVRRDVQPLYYFRESSM